MVLMSRGTTRMRWPRWGIGRRCLGICSEGLWSSPRRRGEGREGLSRMLMIWLGLMN
jgi:hypothetical protein